MKKEIVSKVMFVFAGVFLLLAIIFASIGFNKINKYENPDSVFGSSVNAYVGGDAYNFIINGTYFAGYCAFGGALLVCAVISAVSGLYFCGKADDEKKLDEIRKAETHSPAPVSAPAPAPSIVPTSNSEELKAPVTAPAESSSPKIVAPTTLGEDEIVCPKCGKRQAGWREMCFQCGALLEGTKSSNV